MVPRLIHCCWFGGAKTRLARRCQASWARFASGWEVCEWDESRASALADLPGYDFFASALAARKWAMASDWLRMAVLWKEGGVYLDCDVELVAGLDSLMSEGEWVASEWTARGETWLNPGSGIALAPRSEIARCMLEAYARTSFDPARDMMPWINAQLGEAQRASSALCVLPPEVMSPIDLCGRLHRTARTVAIHHYALSWGGPVRKMLQWLSWHGGRGLVDAAVGLKRWLRANGTAPRLVASFWEEHCLECGMPVCYGTCGMFERGWHGRCVRIDGFEESVAGTGTFRFRRWGKIEMMYHGRMAGQWLACLADVANTALRVLWRLLGMRHRALRWRLLAALGRAGCPNAWRLRLRSVRDERLAVAIGYEDGREVWRETMALAAGEERVFEWPIPLVENGALFRVFAMDGEETGEIVFLENSVAERREAGFKCVAWDLDGVVWDGTLSEGEDVKLRPGVMETVRALDERGIVSSLCSKNDADAALAKLEALGIAEWFVFPQISWGAKSAGLKNLAREMNIALDTIAFVDDRAENRAEVRANAPGVRVYDEIEGLGLARCEQASGDVAGLGSRRRQLYREAMARQEAARVYGDDAEAFNRASGLEVALLEVTEAYKERCLELVNRTNQLNMSARRYDAASFAALLACCTVRCVAVRDCYGDYGIVGFAAWQGNCLEELCFSCRVAKRGVERRVLGEILSLSAAKWTARAVKTARNGEILSLLSELGVGLREGPGV